MVEAVIKLKVIDGEVQLATSDIEKLGTAIDKTEKKASSAGKEIKKTGGNIEKSFDDASGAANNLSGGVEGAVQQVKVLGKASKTSGAAMRSALIATGIGAFIVALGFVLENWEAIGETLGFINRDLEKQIKLQRDLIDESEHELTILGLKQKQLEAQGESGEHILELRKKETEQLIVQNELLLEKLKTQLRNEQSAAVELSTFQKLVGLVSGQKLIGEVTEDEQENLRKLREEVQASETSVEKLKLSLIELNNPKSSKSGEAKNRGSDIVREAELSLLGERQREIREREERFQKDLLELKKAGITDLTAVELEYRQDLQAIDEQYRPSLESGGIADPFNEQKEKDALRLEALREGTEEFAIAQNEQIDLEVQGLIKSAEIQNRKTEDEKANADARIRISDEEFAAKQALLDGFSGSLDAVSELVGRQTGAGKALAVASALIDTYASIAAQLRAAAGSPGAAIPGYAIAQAVATGLAGFAAVKNILKVKVPYDKGGASGSFAGGGGGGASAPSFNVVGTSGVNQLAQTLNQEQQPIQAFVVGGDVTSQQEFERNVVETSSI